MDVSNILQLARSNIRPVVDANKDTTITDDSAHPAVSSVNLGAWGSKLLEQLGAEARNNWSNRDEAASGIESAERGVLPDFLEAAAEITQANVLVTTVDAQNPTITISHGPSFELENLFGFNGPIPSAISVSPGDGPSALINLSRGDQLPIQVFVVNQNGEQNVYLVEDGQITSRISHEQTINLDEGRTISFGLDGTPITIEVDQVKIELSSDLATILHRRSEIYATNLGTTVYDTASGESVLYFGAVNLDPTSTQSLFGFYSWTPEGRATLDLEGDVYTTEAEKRIFIARVRYLRDEGGAELFNDFTPRRVGLTGADLEAYDAEVDKVMNYLREIGVNTIGGIAVGGNSSPNQLDESMIYMLASAVVESHGASPARIDSIIADIDQRWIVSIDNADGSSTGAGASTSAGWYNSDRSTLQVSLDSFVRDFAKPNDSFDIIAHELAHSLEISDGTRDGIPTGMSAQNAQIVRDERDRLFALAYPDQTIDLTINQDTTTVVDNSDIRDYAYTNEVEFWAVISGQFLSSDAGAERLMDTSPELSNVLREYYGRNDLPAAGGPEIAPPGKPEITWPPITGPYITWQQETRPEIYPPGDLWTEVTRPTFDYPVNTKS